jgi:formylglycine-generating enzyme required for sulfatase activity
MKLLVMWIGLLSMASYAAEGGDASKRGVTTEIASRLGELITIPAGSFLMGNNGNEPFSPDAELPQHSVDLPGYQIGKYEVTRGEYRRFIEAGGYDEPGYWSEEGWTWKEKVGRKEPAQWATEQEWVGHGYGPHRFAQTDKHPVVGATYYEAEAYCKWAGGSLPTEAEWEKAARWTGSHPNVFPWGDTWDPEKCNNLHDSSPAAGGHKRLQSAPVGSYPQGASPYGCMDMVGNAYEWVADWYKSYPGARRPVDRTGEHRFPRGGCWDDGPNNKRCAYRGWSLPPDRSGPNPKNDCDHIGFRVARSIAD